MDNNTRFDFLRFETILKISEVDDIFVSGLYVSFSTTYDNLHNCDRIVQPSGTVWYVWWKWTELYRRCMSSNNAISALIGRQWILTYYKVISSFCKHIAAIVYFPKHVYFDVLWRNFKHIFLPNVQLIRYIPICVSSVTSKALWGVQMLLRWWKLSEDHIKWNTFANYLTMTVYFDVYTVCFCDVCVSCPYLICTHVFW